jgi:Fur family ferric uptake transcriptional regulator
MGAAPRPPRPAPRPRSAAPAPADRDVPARAAAISGRLKARGLKHSTVRDVVVEEFLRAGTHVTIEQLLDRVRARVPATGYSTVYRTLRLLEEQGFATARDFGGAHTLFEPADVHHHDHLVCVRCGAVREFEDPSIEKLQERAARRVGFRITSHRLELYGVCAACASQR